VAVSGPLIVDEIELLIRGSLDGAGLAFLSEEHAAPHLASGALVRVLEDWCPPFPGYFLYYPSRRQQPAALSALIETCAGSVTSTVNSLEAHPIGTLATSRADNE
jgi:DNA-binding transcriptional LysR family regulator